MKYKELFYNALEVLIEINGGNIEEALNYCGVSSEEDRCRLKKYFTIYDDEKFIKTADSSIDIEDFANALIANNIAFSYGITGVYVYEEDLSIAKNILKKMKKAQLIVNKLKKEMKECC